MIVDTHAHIYSPDEVAYPVIEKPYRPPAGAGSPEHLREEMRKAGVDRVMMVQTTTFYGWDNTFVRDTAMRSGEWAVGVCTLNPDDRHSPDVLYALVERANVKALRTYASGPERTYDTLGNRRLYGAARACGIVINALLSLKQADGLARMLADHPDVSVVLDHCLALDAKRDFEATVEKVIALARYPNLTAKLTFLPTGSAEEYPFRDMHPATRRFIDAYGPERCIWGSDFPTELWCPRTTYAGHLELFQKHLGLSQEEQEAILGETATRLYGLT
ncbi:MAG TPA: amidohydrolase family protein [Chloroflexota bacterium]|nr:amidohydrolase family protein [Chloroflexota bacterium]